jgi:FMN phosphatase YigB (HAD superfamily)
MPRSQIVIFDLGKVLVDFDYRIAARKIATRARLPVDIIRFFTTHASLLLSYEVGRVTTHEFFGEMCKATGFSGTPEEFGEFFADIFTEIPEMIELHAQLRRQGFPTYIFSNTNELAVMHIRRRFPFFAGFDGYFYSYEHGALKPDAEFYEIVERETKRNGAEIVYLDDRPENAAAGAARGWSAIQHETPEKTRKALEGLGIPV